jgi:hypothetical protein
VVYPIPADVAQVMRRSHTARYVADAFYDGLPTLSGMSVSSSGSIDGSASGRVQTTASIAIQANAMTHVGQGGTIAPQYAVDALATYGQEIVISRQILFGRTVVATIPCGTFRISEAPTISRYGRPFGSDYVYTAEAVELKLDDRFEPIDAADLPLVQSPRSGGTMWSEVRRFSPFPVVVASDIPDRSVAKTMVYEQSRLDTITDLLALAGAQPKMTREGSLSARLTDPTGAPIDLTGTIQPFERSMSKDFTNHVIVTTVVDGADQVLAEAQVTEGPLRVNGPAGDRVDHVDSGLADTRTAAAALAASRLRAGLQGRREQVKVSCLPNLTIELGDPIIATDPYTGDTVEGTVDGFSLPMDPTDLMTVTIGTKVYL